MSREGSHIQKRFPHGKKSTVPLFEGNGFYDDAIVCAQNRELAETIIGELTSRQRAEMGVAGLSKRIRAKLKEFEGDEKPQRKKRASELKDG
jgi:hypothetical protein